MARILVVDDEPTIVSLLSALLKAEGHEVVTALDGETVIGILDDTLFDLMITDIRMARVTGIDLLRMAHEKNLQIAIIVMTAHESVETAVQALKLGAFDYITKPLKIDELMTTIQRALEYRQSLTGNEDLKTRLGKYFRFDGIVAESPAMQQVCEMIERVAPTDTSVFIHGESGAGKRLVAKTIHSHSMRRDKQYITVNCSGLPETSQESEMFGHVKGAGGDTGATADEKGVFEAANGGTILLEKVESMTDSVQSKLQSMLQTKEIRRLGETETRAVDVRVLTSTSRDLKEEISKGMFRENLFRRLSVVAIEVKPLRDRREDVLPIAYRVLRDAVAGRRDVPVMAGAVRLILEQYDWPGNVRELENVMKHALMLSKSDTLSVEALPPGIADQVRGASATQGPAGSGDDHRAKSLKSFLRAKEGEYLKEVLARAGGDKEKAAKILRVGFATLCRKLSELGLD